MNQYDAFWNNIDSEWKQILIINSELENNLTDEQKKSRSFWLSPYENYINLIGKEIDLSAYKEALLTPKLDIYGTAIANINPLSDYISLKEFYCGATSVSDLTPLSQLTSLEKLCCYNTRVRNLLPLSNILSLKRLCLSGTNIKDIGPLRSLINLEKLSIYKTNVDDLEPVNSLYKLEKLNINHTKVSSLQPLDNLINLKEVHCYNTLLSIEELLKFKKHHPQCLCISEYEQPESEYDDFE